MSIHSFSSAGVAYTAWSFFHNPTAWTQQRGMERSLDAVFGGNRLKLYAVVHDRHLISSSSNVVV